MDCCLNSHGNMHNIQLGQNIMWLQLSQDSLCDPCLWEPRTGDHSRNGLQNC